LLKDLKKKLIFLLDWVGKDVGLDSIFLFQLASSWHLLKLVFGLKLEPFPAFEHLTT